MTRYQNSKLQQHFDLLLTFARNGGSELFAADGGQRGGASHRNAFWNGFNGRPNYTYSRGTFNYVGYYAGREFAKEQSISSGYG